MTGVIVRIALRYVAGALVSYGVLAPDDAAVITGDPELEQALVVAAGAVIGFATEVAYRLARKLGWAT